MASDAADALAKTYARNKKLLSLRSITNSLQQTGLLEACTYPASVPRRPPLPGLLYAHVGSPSLLGSQPGQTDKPVQAARV